MSESQPFEAIVNRILENAAPQQVRAAAARGALPLPRATLCRLYLFLRADAEESIRQDAENSLKVLTPEVIQEVLEDPACAPEVMDYFAVLSTKNETLAERIAFHRAVPNSALATLAASGNAAVIELVLTNQERLLSQPELLDRLSVNPALRADQRGKIFELLERAARFQEKVRAGDDGTHFEGDTAEFEAAARMLDVDVGELFAQSEILDGEEFETTDDPELRSAYRRIVTLNTAQKALLAMKGGREERMILVRDTNKIVSLSVLRNPRMTEEDAGSIARLRSVSNEVLRQIGTNREWIKSYGVVTALVNNPRTPQGVSTNLVSRLQKQDLKKVMANHDVPELIRRMARSTLDMRTQPSVSPLKKKK